MFNLKFILSTSIVVALYSCNAFAGPDPSGLFPQDSDTMVSDCMLDGNKSIRAILNNREMFEQSVGKERASNLLNEITSKTRKAMAECEARSPEEKAEIEKKYELEYGYKRPPSPPSGTAGSGSYDHYFSPGGMFNPIHVKVH